MKRLLVLITCCLACCSSAARAQGTDQLDDGHLRRIEKSIRMALAEIEDELSFEYRKSLPNTLVVNYRTRTFMVHGQSKRGEYTEKAQETVGPSYRGFRLRLTLEEAGFINAAGVPQTFRKPYWTTYLDTRLLEGTDVQVYRSLSYGRQVDEALLKQVRKVITDLGDAPYLKREPEEMTGPAPDAPPAGERLERLLATPPYLRQEIEARDEASEKEQVRAIKKLEFLVGTWKSVEPENAALTPEAWTITMQIPSRINAPSFGSRLSRECQTGVQATRAVF